MTDDEDPLGSWVEPFADLPEGDRPETTLGLGVQEICDSCLVRAVQFASPIRDASGRLIPLGGLMFTFGNSETKFEHPVSYVGTPEILRALGKAIRDAAYRAANLAEGKR